MPGWRWQGEDLHLDILVSPRARRNEMVGWHGDALRIRVAAVPAGGAANRRLLAFLADCFGVPASGVSLESGGSGRRKRVAVRSPRVIPEPLREVVARPGSSD